MKGTKSRDNFEQQTEAYTIAELVKESSKKAHLTQEQLAEKINVKKPIFQKQKRQQAM